MIERIIRQEIEQRFSDHKVIVVTGPRQVGKSTLLREALLKDKVHLFIDGDDNAQRAAFEGGGLDRIRRLVGTSGIVFIDEAQRIPEIGLVAKIIHDQLPDIKLILSGSAALELHQKIVEPLTGRKWTYMIFPISWMEWEKHNGRFQSMMNLQTRLIYGMYPEVINNPGLERQVLTELTDSYLYKDVLEYAGIRKPDILIKLLQALAYQVGSEVSYNELAQTLQLDKNTIMTYIDLLEKVFVIFRLEPFSRNLRNELMSTRKIYFYDNGVRNALIGNFTEMTVRTDKGALWENFLVSERWKSVQYAKMWSHRYFWRTYQQQEIDYLEERNGAIRAWEFKWNAKAKARFSKTFLEAYKPVLTEIVTPENFQDFFDVKEDVNV